MSRVAIALFVSVLLTSPSGAAKPNVVLFLADDLGCTAGQLAIAWCARNPHVSTVITGASRVEQVRENMAAIDVMAVLERDPEALQRLDRAFAPVAR